MGLTVKSLYEGECKKFEAYVGEDGLSDLDWLELAEFQPTHPHRVRLLPSKTPPARERNMGFERAKPFAEVQEAEPPGVPRPSHLNRSANRSQNVLAASACTGAPASAGLVMASVM